MGWLIVTALGVIAYFWWKNTTEQRKKTSTIRAKSEGLTESLDGDNWDTPTDLIPSNPKPVRVTLRLSYQDASKKISERLVDVKECDTTNPAGYLFGFCHLRQSVRTFRIDRIQQAVDVETGEIITNLSAYANQKYEESPIASLDRLFADSIDAIRGLFYIGKADGRFTAKEKQIFLHYCQTAANDSSITMSQIDAACKNLPTPTKQAYKLICGRLAKLDERQRAAILAATEEMIATEKTISGEEAEALDYMKKKLGSPTRMEPAAA